MTKKLTIEDFMKMKREKIPVAAVVLYEYWLAQLAEKSKMNWLLVGDPANMTIYGEKTTAINPPTMECMLKHTKAVRDGAPHTFIVGDMPEGSYGKKSICDGLFNAKRFIQGGADAIKLEGGKDLVEQIEKIVKTGKIAVMGHIGLTPQTVPQEKWGKVYGETAEEAEKLLEDARALQEAGAFAVLLEKVAEETAEIITQTLKIPVFGIGAGRYCDGQLLLSCDMLGSFSAFTPKFVKKYPSLIRGMTCFEVFRGTNNDNWEIITERERHGVMRYKVVPNWFSMIAEEGFEEYAKEVRTHQFPEEKHVYHMKNGE